MPGILGLDKKFKPHGFKLILVSADEADTLEGGVKPALKRLGVDFPTYIIGDSTEEAFIAEINPDWSGAIPTSFVFDRRGTLGEMLVGERTQKEFEAALLKYLK